MTNGEEQALVSVKDKSPIKVGQRGLVLTSLDDLYRFSRYIAASGWAPPGLSKPEAIVVALQYGLELGMSPMQSLQDIAVINGRPAIYGDAMLAVCMSACVWDHKVFSERFEGDEGTDEYRAVCTVGRLGRAEQVTRSFSVAQAKKAGLWGKAGPWTQYPTRMLQLRARAWALRDAFPDVLRGAMAIDELLDVEPTTTTTTTPRSGIERVAARLGVGTSGTQQLGDVVQSIAQASCEAIKEGAGLFNKETSDEKS